MSNFEAYKPYFDQWPKDAGPKPKQADLKQIHEAGIAKVGSKTALAVAMSLRERGVTQDQIKMVLGQPYRNKLTHLVATGICMREHVNGGRPMVYKLVLRTNKPAKA